MKEKGNQAGASEGASGGEILMKEKGYQAGASEGGGDREKENQSSALPEVGEILRRKKEMWRSYRATFSEDTKLLSMRLRMAQAGSGETETKTKRKTKVIQKEVPVEVIEFMKKAPYYPIIGEPFTDDELAKRDEFFREAYTKCMARSVKIRAYYQALIDQYDTTGRAFDEEEVTDDEED